MLDVRTTVTLADDVAAEVERLRREHGIGLSEALNSLVRRGMTASGVEPPRIVPFTADVGVMIDGSNVAEALELLDQFDAEDRRLADAG